jgi:AcrR family transcriptional regulator
LTIRARGADVSLDDLAAAAGVSKPVLYSHFTDKAGLADALAVDVAARLEAQVLGRAGIVGTDVAAVLRNAVDAFCRFVSEEPQLYRFIVRSMKVSDADVLDNALVRILAERTAAVLKVALPDIDRDRREIAAVALLGQVFGAAEAWQQHRRVSRRKLVDTLVALSLDGFRGLAAI